MTEDSDGKNNTTVLEILAEMLRRIDIDKAIDSIWQQPLDEEFIDEIAGQPKPNLSIIENNES